MPCRAPYVPYLLQQLSAGTASYLGNNCKLYRGNTSFTTVNASSARKCTKRFLRAFPPVRRGWVTTKGGGGVRGGGMFVGGSKPQLPENVKRTHYPGQTVLHVIGEIFSEH